MKVDRNKLAITILAYAYWPIAYFGIYLPLIVPSLDHWTRIPLWILFLICLGFAIVLISMGKWYSTKANLLHALGLHVSLLLFLSLLAKLVMPGFKKGGSGKGGILDLLINVLLPIMIIFALEEGGRVLMPRKVHE